MKKKTSNAQRRTLNVEFGTWRVSEIPDGECDSNRKPNYDLEDRLPKFAADIIELTESLPKTRAGNHIAGQLLRCGTSSLSNHGEVEAAQSRRDFLHKLRICLKELRETKRWLRLVGRTRIPTAPTNFTAYLDEVEEVIRIFVASIRTVQRQMIGRAFELDVGRSAFGVFFVFH